MSQLDELLDRRATYIDRWHHRPVRQHESVAEHQWSTTFIAMVLARYLSEREWPVSVSLTMQMALLHDQAEVVTGDLPHSFKNDSPDRKTVWEGWEREVVDDLFTGFNRSMATWLRSFVLREPMDDEPSLRYEREIVELADKLSAYAFAEQEVAQGNSLFDDIVVNTAGLCLGQLRAAAWGDAIDFAIPGLSERLRRASLGFRPEI